LGGKSRIPDPVKTVVPVPDAAKSLGQEVVAAAAMLPVSPWVKSLSTRPERTTPRATALGTRNFLCHIYAPIFARILWFG